MSIPTGAARKALLVSSAAGAAYFGALMLLCLTPLTLMTVGSQIWLPALIALGPLLVLVNALLIWRWAKVESSGLAYRDDLTGLPNRRAFMARAVEALKGARAGSLALVLFDIDGLKRLNDHCGHEAGDELIVNAARLLQARAGKASAVYRVGGDEFALLVDRGQGGMLAKFVLSLGTPLIGFEACGHQHEVGISFGFASCRDDESFESLFRRADLRLYESKERLYAPERRRGLRSERRDAARPGSPPETGPGLKLIHSITS